MVKEKRIIHSFFFSSLKVFLVKRNVKDNVLLFRLVAMDGFTAVFSRYLHASNGKEH